VAVLAARTGLLKGMAAVAGAAITLLAACTRDPFVSVNSAETPSAGEWRIERQVDRVTGAPISNAVLITNQVSNANLLIAPPARLNLACFKTKPAVIIAFAFKIGSTRNAELGYRFDDKPGHEPHVRIVDDYKTVIIEDPQEVAQFVNELATSSGLYVRIRSLNAARTSAEFKVAGAPAAIAAAYAGCPLTPATHASASTPVRAGKRSLPQAVGGPFGFWNLRPDRVVKRHDRHVIGRRRAGERERVPFSTAAEGAALGHDGVVMNSRFRHGIGDRAIGAEMSVGLANPHHGGVVAELFEPLGRRQHLQCAFDSTFGGRGLRGNEHNRTNRPSECSHALPRLHGPAHLGERRQARQPMAPACPEQIAAGSAIFRVAIQKLDRNTLRPA
jgi:hypothetical protein